MGDTHSRYLTLMASMPPLRAPFVARQLPVSRLRLDARLGLLEDDDARLLRRIEAVMEWERIDIGSDDADIVADLGALMAALHSESLRTVVRDRFELRTVLAAMRRCRRNEPAPSTEAPWGYGRFTEQIRRNWNRPHFGLRRSMHWVGEVRELYDAGNTLELERAITRIEWESLTREGHEHEFDFEAVVLYVLRYNLVARWLGYSVPEARTRFDTLVTAGLGEHGALVTESA